MAKAKAKAKDNRAFAFWRYDLCPHIVSGEVTKQHRDGTVQIDGFGITRFRPLAVIKGAEGEAAAKHMEHLRSQFNTAERTLRDWFSAEAEKLIAKK